MAIVYHLYQDTRKKSSTQGKWYARVCSQGTVNLDDLVDHMATHNSPFSRGTIQGVLKDMVGCVRELVLNGQTVKLDNLALFSIGIHTKPAESAKEFSAKQNIVGYKLRARSTGSFTAKELALSAMSREDNRYVIDKEDAAPADPADGE